MRDGVIFFYGNINYKHAPSALVPFFEIEYSKLRQCFKKVVVVAGCRDKESVKSLPCDNAEFVLLTRKEVLCRAYLAFAMLLTPDFWLELFSAIKKRARLSDFLKAMAFAFHGRALAAAAKRVCRKYNLKQNGKNWTAYSFWHSGEVYAVACLKRWFPQIRAVTRAHAGDIDAKINPPMAVLMRETIPKYVDKICFSSKNAVNKYKRTIGALADSKVEVVYLGVRKLADAQSAQSRDGWLRIVSCANLKPGKRIDLVVKALALALEHGGIKIQWTHFGGGELEQTLREMANDCFAGRDNIRWQIKGHTPNEEIHRHYIDSPVDLFISMSESEGIPVSFIEAMAYGVPIISTDVGGVREILLEGCGIIIGKPDEKAAAKAIIDYWGLSEQEKQKMRRKAFKVFSDNFDLDTNFSHFARSFLK